MNRLLERITVDPDILGGKPIIRGTRLSVEFILDLLASGMMEDEIIQEYPHLERDDIRACLQYAARSLHNEVIVSLEAAA
ncbi:MAG TPA: DUF433 domain-containing protein [Anaerolineae bacterium]|nr:DUF433 domain-containing protein [Anaerolineae bacterium]